MAAALAIAFATLAALTTAQDAVEILAVGGAVVVVAGAVGALGLRAARRNSMRAEVLVCAVSAALATATGAWIVTRWALDISAPLPTLSAVLFLVTGAIGIAASLVLAAQLSAATHSLARLSAQLPGGEKLRPGRVPSVAILAANIERLASQLEASRERERALENSRRELIAGISHDLRTPLNALNAMANALEDGVVPETEEVARYHRTMSRETQRLIQLVEDLFELSRIEAGVDLQFEPVEFLDVLSDAVAEANPLAAQRGVSLDPQLAADLPVVWVSPQHAHRILSNLLDNAIRYSTPGADITVSARADGEDVEVSVSDGCGGIPEKDLERIFDVAYQRQHARAGGSGLGLAIAQRLVRLHGGRIGVHNEQQGCRFVVRLPVAPHGRTSNEDADGEAG